MQLNLTEKNKNLFIKTILWNILVDIFKKEKNIDIEKYLISIKNNSKKIVIKTNKPILNSEFLLLDEKIKKIFYEKMKNAGVEEKNFEFKYI